MNRIPCTRNRDLLRASRSSLLQLWVVLATVTLIASSRSLAAPVTFAFNATIADGTSTPFSAVAGENLDGTYSFDPGSPGPLYMQPHELRLHVSGNTLVVAQFEIAVEDNLLKRIDTPGRIADPDNTPDVDFNGIGDNKVVSCGLSGQTFCGTIEGNSGFLFQPLLVFSDQADQISSSDLSGNASDWNAFPLREMSLLFKDIATGETAYLGAYINQVVAVPEPTSETSIVLLIVLSVLHCRTYRMEFLRIM